MTAAVVDLVLQPTYFASDASDPEPTDQSRAPDLGVPRMIPEVLQECCIKNGGYRSPDLNEALFLQYKGFRKLENLEGYSNVKSLFLECNGLSRIENLDAMSKLLSLYLQSNCLTRIENLSSLKSLQYLNIAHNGICRVEHLSSLPSLATINLSHNKLVEIDSLHGLAECPTLKSIDISSNYIEDGEGLVNFWFEPLPDLECLYLHHNPCSRAVANYRRRIVSGLRRLRWLDDRLVVPLERVGCEAWAAGGKDAEVKAKQDFFTRTKDAKAESFSSYQRIGQAATERAQAQRELQVEQDRLRQSVAHNLGALSEGWCSLPAHPALSDMGLSRSSREEEEGLEATLRAKVQSFLSSRRPPVLVDRDAARRSPVLVHGDAASGSWSGTSTAELAPTSSDICSAPIPDTPEVSGPWRWTGFRDKRLGRLVAQHRYNFVLAAEALSHEFASSVDAASCRARYGELLRPAGNSAGGVDSVGAAGSGRLGYQHDAQRAKDVRADPDSVKDYTEWWMRQMGTGNDSKGISAATIADPSTSLQTQTSQPIKAVAVVGCGAVTAVGRSVVTTSSVARTPELPPVEVEVAGNKAASLPKAQPSEAPPTAASISAPRAFGVVASSQKEELSELD